jgi:hypothetical protein
MLRIIQVGFSLLVGDYHIGFAFSGFGTECPPPPNFRIEGGLEGNAASQRAMGW